jgi:hypothetical protein
MERKMKPGCSRNLIASLVLLALPASVKGQAKTSAEPMARFEIAGGYSVAFVPGEYTGHSYAGWAAEQATFIRDRLAIVALVGGNYWSHTYDANISESDNLYGFLGGVRRTGARTKRVVPLAQFLAGAAYSNATLVAGGYSTPISSTGFAIQPGVGFEVTVLRGLGIRASLDGRVISPQYSEAWHFTEWRLGLETVYRIGSR